MRAPGRKRPQLFRLGHVLDKRHDISYLVHHCRLESRGIIVLDESTKSLVAHIAYSHFLDRLFRVSRDPLYSA